MEEKGGLIGTRQSDLIKSFKLAIRALLTPCSKEEFSKAFSRFNGMEQERLHRLFIQVVTSLHKDMEEEFESLCHEIQVLSTLDTIEQLVEEQSLDSLFSKKSNLVDVANNLSTAKKNEINHLMGMLEAAEEQNRLIRSRIELLKKGIGNTSQRQQI